MKKVELLAPAGSYESFLGAIHAGADAVYLGGNKFSARAYADNFTEEEIVRAVRYAHLHGRKVYLTVNTLIKEREFSGIYPFLEPFYQAGLDAVIIQDMGMFERIGEWFPDLERHISTQMTVTGTYGAEWFKEKGADRIVPARELSLSEIREIKEKTGIEIETFIHGAMCYCYSGQCLFSSLLGGRSGNRGRCAQPCRLPCQITSFEADGQVARQKETYPLSLKDMCTLEMLPELIRAGIDSFKIEGRMKSPEYAAGVTAIYRKYIDRYYTYPEQDIKADSQDMHRLKSLYIRSGISEGYYKRHNGREMVTLERPGYSGTDEKLTAEIRRQYLGKEIKFPAQGKILLKKGEPARYTVSSKELSACVSGECVQEAKNRPLSKSDVRKQLLKSGNTVFVFEQLDIDMDDDIFMPVKRLNELRREACFKLEEKIIASYGLGHPDRRDRTSEAEASAEQPEAVAFKEKGRDTEGGNGKRPRPQLHAAVLLQEQLEAAVEAGINRIYVPLENMDRKLLERVGEETELYLALPYILRRRDVSFLEEAEGVLKERLFTGALARNLEELKWLEEIGFHENIVTDTGMYLWNNAAGSVYSRESNEQYLPLELNAFETEELLADAEDLKRSEVIYGRIPMMVSANCVAKTITGCRKEKGMRSTGPFLCLTDRYRKKFPVFPDCIHCYNIIYNSVPLSLHQNIIRLEKSGVNNFRLDFTVEDRQKTGQVISFFQKLLESEKDTVIPPPFTEYTNGHFKRGVE